MVRILINNRLIWKIFPFILITTISLAFGHDYKTIPVGENPESVTRGWNGFLYVTLMGETRVDGDGNGSIAVIDQNNRVRTFTERLNDPKGLAFTGDLLITADFTRVWKIDSHGKKSILADKNDFPDTPLYLNDVAIAPDGQSVFVTDMGARDQIHGPDGLWPLGSAEARAVPAFGRVFRITLEGEVSNAVDRQPGLICPNGIDALPDGRIRVVDFFTGSLLEFYPEGGPPRVLADGFRNGDAIAHDKDGMIYVSKFITGRLFRLHLNGAVETVAKGLKSAADFYLDRGESQIIIPDLLAGELVLVPL